MSARRVRIGGLLRCSVQAVYDYEGPEEPGVTIVTCRWCPQRVRLADDGVWEWDR